MKTNAGLWIDHRKAIVVAITPRGEETGLILSKVERQRPRSATSPPAQRYDPRQLPAEDSRQRAYRNHLNLFYDAVVAYLHGADAILIFGPGEAKLDLKKHLVKHRLGSRIASVEPADRMTDRQVAAKVRAYYAA